MKKAPEDCKSIDDVRFEIDSIDYQLIQLIVQRGKFVRVAAKYKTDKNSVKAEDRVAAMIGKRREWANEMNLNPDFIESQFRSMVQYFVNLELEEWKSKN